MIRSSLRSSSSTQGVPSTCAKRAVTSYSSCPRYSIRLWVVFSSSACRAASPTASPACTCSAVSMRTEGNTLRSCSISCSACCRVIDPPCAVFSSLSCTPVSPFFSMVRPGVIILFFAWLRQTCCRLSRHRKILEKWTFLPAFCLSGPDRRAAVRRKVTQNRECSIFKTKAPARFRKFRHADGRTVLSKKRIRTRSCSQCSSSAR